MLSTKSHVRDAPSGFILEKQVNASVTDSQPTEVMSIEKKLINLLDSISISKATI